MSRKVGLWEMAFAEEAQDFATHYENCFDSLHNLVVKRQLRRTNCQMRAEMIIAALNIVASERSYYMNGYGESTSLDKFALSTVTENASVHTDAPDQHGDKKMDINKFESRDVKCYQCDRKGDVRKDCHVRLEYIPQRTREAFWQKTGGEG